MAPHPLDGLSQEEVKIVRQLVLDLHPNLLVNFRVTFLREPRKEELLKFLAVEHTGELSASTPRPLREALCHYDVIAPDKSLKYKESIIDLTKAKVVETEVVDPKYHSAISPE